MHSRPAERERRFTLIQPQLSWLTHVRLALCCLVDPGAAGPSEHDGSASASSGPRLLRIVESCPSYVAAEGEEAKGASIAAIWPCSSTLLSLHQWGVDWSSVLPEDASLRHRVRRAR